MNNVLVDTVDNVTGSQKSAVATISLVSQRITPGGAYYHVVKMYHSSFDSRVARGRPSARSEIA